MWRQHHLAVGSNRLDNRSSILAIGLGAGGTDVLDEAGNSVGRQVSSENDGWEWAVCGEGRCLLNGH